jgi:Lysylphosphatidylglycerol synthase TM region
VGSVGDVALIAQSPGDFRAPQRALSRLVQVTRSRTGRIALFGVSGVVVFVLAVVAGRHFAETVWPLSVGRLGLLVAAALLSLLGYTFKAYGWRQLFAAHERPRVLALAAANGGASVTALAFPGRFDDVVRIAIVRSFRGCPAGVRTLCLSLFMLGLIDTVALAPFALAATVLPGHSLGARLGLALLTVAGLAAGALIVLLPRLAASPRLLRFRLGRWLRPRTTSFRDASQAWALVSACWLTRALGVLVLLGALGTGFSFTLALLFLCASSAAAALPVGPGGTAMQAGAGAAVLIASGVGVSEAVAVAVAVHTLGMLVGGSIFLYAAASRSAVGLAQWYRPLRVPPLRVRVAGEVSQ